jgi:hypothetical protein
MADYPGRDAHRALFDLAAQNGGSPPLINSPLSAGSPTLGFGRPSLGVSFCPLFMLPRAAGICLGFISW